MGKKALALAATAVMGVSGVLAASPATAGTTTKAVPGGYYTQWTGALRCTGIVYDGGSPSGGAGGTLGVEVKAAELRIPSTHFRTARVSTRIVAQELNYFGVWKDVKSSTAAIGHLGPARAAGAYNIARVKWNGDYSPVLRVRVHGHDDLFRAKVVSRFYNDEGNLIARLVNFQGRCQL